MRLTTRQAANICFLLFINTIWCLDRIQPIQVLKGQPIALFEDWNDTPITFIQEDINAQGVYLAILGSALVRINGTDNQTTILAGLVSDNTFLNGLSTEARFSDMMSFVQEENRRKILVADSGNSCIRSVDRLTLYVTTYSGTCNSTKILGETVIDGSLTGASYGYPYDMVQLKTRIVLTDEHRLRVIDSDKEAVTTKFTSQHTNRGASIILNRIAVDSKSSKIYVTTSTNSISVFDFQLRLLKELRPVYVRGMLLDYAGIVVLSQSALLVTTGLTSRLQGLFIVNLETAKTRKVCLSSPGNWSCRHETNGEYITKISGHRLLMSGYPEAERHAGAEVVKLNDRCTDLEYPSVFHSLGYLHIEDGGTTSLRCEQDPNTYEPVWIPVNITTTDLSTAVTNSVTISTMSVPTISMSTSVSTTTKHTVMPSWTTKTHNDRVYQNLTSNKVIQNLTMSKESAKSNQTNDNKLQLLLSTILPSSLIILSLAICAISQCYNKKAIPADKTSDYAARYPIKGTQDPQKHEYATVDDLHLYDEISSDYNVRADNGDPPGRKPQPAGDHNEPIGDSIYVINPETIYVSRL